jgi:hypothetical protein
MEIALRHHVTYGTKNDVPISVVARSLVGNERMFRESLRLLELAHSGLKVGAISIKVAELTNSSQFSEVLVATLVVTFQEDLTEEVPDLIQKLLGVNVPDNMDTFVSLLVTGTVLYTIGAAVERLMPGRSAKKIMAEYESKKDRLSELTGIDKAVIERYASDRLVGRQGLLDKALDFFAPAKLEPGASILLPSGETIGPDLVSEIPYRAEFDDADLQDHYELSGVEIRFHRSDMDEKKYGWRAVVPAVSEKKVRAELGSQVDSASLYGVRAAVGDVIVHEGRGAHGNIEVKRYEIVSVRL